MNLLNIIINNSLNLKNNKLTIKKVKLEKFSRMDISLKLAQSLLFMPAESDNYPSLEEDAIKKSNSLEISDATFGECIPRNELLYLDERREQIERIDERSPLFYKDERRCDLYELDERRCLLRGLDDLDGPNFPVNRRKKILIVIILSMLCFLLVCGLVLLLIFM